MSAAYPYPIIAREGWVHVAVTAIATALAFLYGGFAWGVPLAILLVFVLQFFRDPPRTIPSAPGAVLAPADGRVIKVDEVDDPYLKRRALRISIFMNVFNVHANRAPVAGEIRDRWYFKGAFVNAALDKAAAENERNALWVRTPEGADVVFVQVAGLIARRILCYVDRGSRVAAGQRYGFIRFGSRVDLYLPLGSKAEVAIGDTTRCGSQVVARLPG